MPKTAKRPTRKGVKPTAVPASTKTDVKTERQSGIRRVRLPMPKYKPLSLKKQIKPVRPPITGSFRLMGRALTLLKAHWQLFLGLLAIYALLDIILVNGLGNSSGLSDLKSSLQGKSGQFSTGVTLFVSLLGGSFSSSGSSNGSGGLYQGLLLIVISLAVIWGLRELSNNAQITVRDMLYKGMGPFIPFLLVLLVIGLQLIPLAIGALLYGLAVTNGIVVNGFEQIVFLVIFLSLAALSLFWVCSSVFALYIVTLQNMTPMKALRSARQLVRYRRLTVLRKIIFLPAALFVIGAIIVIPIGLFLTPVAVWVFLMLSLLSLFIVHSYMYGLYRELLQ